MATYRKKSITIEVYRIPEKNEFPTLGGWQSAMSGMAFDLGGYASTDWGPGRIELYKREKPLLAYPGEYVVRKRNGRMKIYYSEDEFLAKYELVEE